MEEKLNIAICEDTKAEEEKLVSIISKSNIKCVLTVYHSAEELLEEYAQHKFDLLLMDIYMGKINGVDAVKKIREIDEEVPISFITTSPDFTLESYRLSVLKYIEKPYKEKDVYEILRLAKLQKDSVPKLLLHKNGRDEYVALSQIIYIEVQSRQLAIHLKNGEIINAYEKISDIMKRLPSELFFSFHKSYCVNFSEVQYIDEEIRCFCMSDGSNVPIRRENLAIAKSSLEKYLFERTRGY